VNDGRLIALPRNLKEPDHITNMLLVKYMTQEKTRILIVDDHAIMRKSIQALLESQPDMEVVGTAANGREAIELAQAYEPDVIVMDISMPILDGMAAAAQIKSLGLSPRVLLLSMHHNAILVQQARKNGVIGYIIKQQANRDLIPAVRAARAGIPSF